MRVPTIVRQFILRQYEEGNKSTREVSKNVLNTFGMGVSNVSISRMFKDGKRYFGKELQVEKTNSKRDVKEFTRNLFGKEVTHKPFKFNRKILTIK